MFNNRFMAWVFLVRMILLGVSERVIYRWKRLVSGEDKSPYLVMRERAHRQLGLSFSTKREGLMTEDRGRVLTGNSNPEVEEDTDEIPGSFVWTMPRGIRIMATILLLGVMGVVLSIILGISYLIPK